MIKKSVQMASKILCALFLLGLVAWVVFYFMADESSAIPQPLLLGSFIVTALLILFFVICGIWECVLMVKEKGVKGLIPVGVSFVVFFIIFLLYNFFFVGHMIPVLQWFLTTLVVTLGSCTMNFWKRK